MTIIWNQKVAKNINWVKTSTALSSLSTALSSQTSRLRCCACRLQLCKIIKMTTTIVMKMMWGLCFCIKFCLLATAMRAHCPALSPLVLDKRVTCIHVTLLMMMNCLSVEHVGHRWQWQSWWWQWQWEEVDIDNNVNDNGRKNEDEPEIEPGGHTKPSSNKTLSSCHLER